MAEFKPGDPLVDTPNFREANVTGLHRDRGRPADHDATRFGPSAARRALRPGSPPPDNPTAVAAIVRHLKSPEDRKLCALRKQNPEPVFGVIELVLGFRQFLLRGFDTVRGEWNLVSMANNSRRLFSLIGAPGSRSGARPIKTRNRPSRHRLAAAPFIRLC
jgi:hypothetical protein